MGIMGIMKINGIIIDVYLHLLHNKYNKINCFLLI